MDRRLECYETMRRLHELAGYFSDIGDEDLAEAAYGDFKIYRTGTLTERDIDLGLCEQREREWEERRKGVL